MEPRLPPRLARLFSTGRGPGAPPVARPALRPHCGLAHAALPAVPSGQGGAPAPTSQQPLLGPLFPPPQPQPKRSRPPRGPASWHSSLPRPPHVALPPRPMSLAFCGPPGVDTQPWLASTCRDGSGHPHPSGWAGEGPAPTSHLPQVHPDTEGPPAPDGVGQPGSRALLRVQKVSVGEAHSAVPRARARPKEGHEPVPWAGGAGPGGAEAASDGLSALLQEPRREARRVLSDAEGACGAEAAGGGGPR